MLIACRLAGLSALAARYAGLDALTHANRVPPQLAKLHGPAESMNDVILRIVATAEHK
jgi:hypothetical protein